MQTEFNEVHFEASGDDDWTCHTNEDDYPLGHVYYDDDWKQTALASDPGEAFTADELEDILIFMRRVNESKNPTRPL